MVLEAPEEWDDHPYKFAEWLELLSIARWPNPSGEAELRAQLEGAADDLRLFPTQGDLEEAVESKVQAVFGELGRRATWANGGYPFILTNGTVRLRTDTSQIESIPDCGIAYLFALGATYYRHQYYKSLPKPKAQNDNFPGKE